MNKTNPLLSAAFTSHKLSCLVFIIAFGGGPVIASQQSLDVRGFEARPAGILGSHAASKGSQGMAGSEGNGLKEL